MYTYQLEYWMSTDSTTSISLYLNKSDDWQITNKNLRLCLIN